MPIEIDYGADTMTATKRQSCYWFTSHLTGLNPAVYQLYYPFICKWNKHGLPHSLAHPSVEKDESGR